MIQTGKGSHPEMVRDKQQQKSNKRNNNMKRKTKISKYNLIKHKYRNKNIH
jgi:hypothetical protein